MLKVLVVGPESLSGELGPTVLGRPDIDRAHQPDPARAVDTAGQARPNMVILDLSRESALEVVRDLRAHPVTRPTAIVWLDRSESPEAQDALVSAGANAAIPVPVDPLLWDRRLEELLSVPARRNSLIQVRLRDWSHFVAGADEAEGAILNIGARGVLLETSRELHLGGKVGLRFRLGSDTHEVAAVGQVVRLEQLDGLSRVGVEFLIYRGDARERIAAFVEEEPEPDRPGAPTAQQPLTVRPFEEAREWEEELRASELRKALVLDSATDCIVTVDHEGRILEFNTAARRVFGYSRAEILGREVADTLVPPALRDELRRRLRDFIVTGENPDLGRRRETTAMRADGATFPVEVMVVPAYVKGRVLLTAYVRDLTDQHRARRLGEARQRVTQVLTEALSLAEASPSLLAALADGLECREARLWLTEGRAASLDLAGRSTASGTLSRGEDADDAVARRVVETGDLVWLEDAGPPGSGSALAVPVRGGGQLLGVLEVRCPARRPRQEEWLAALGDMGSHIGLFLKRQRAEADLQRLARYDSLTGLPNRTFFLDTLERTLLRAGHRGSRVALVFLDLDGFKAVNDRLGHAAGDAVLQAMADRLRAGTRSSDLVARIGGDEFTVLVQDLARADDAALVARGLLERMVRPLTLDDEEISLSASAGISVFPDDGRDALTLLRHADLAMYRAKQEGKNDYRFFIAEMSERARERMDLLDGLRAALERDEFSVLYQPIVRRAGPPSLEALLRWRHPDMGLVAPEGFISQAEDSGLILPIGARVLEAATSFATSLPPEVRVVVNLSRRQFLQPDLVAEVEAALRNSGLAPSRLALDLSERTVMTRSGEVKERLQRLRGLGVELALDDFGTGFFSIALIRELGFHRLKIDRSLVAGLPEHADHARQVEAILGLARSLDVEAIAEGVETEAERAFLEERGCTGLQGFLVSPPLDADGARAFLEKHLRA